MRAGSFNTLSLALSFLVLAGAVLRFAFGNRDPTARMMFTLMVAVGAIALLIVVLSAVMPKLLYKTSHGRRCPNCYAKIDREAGFCPKCGMIADNSKSVNLGKCPKCKYRIDDPDREFCPKCGSSLRK